MPNTTNDSALADAVHTYRGAPAGPPSPTGWTIGDIVASQARLRPTAPFLTTVAADGEPSTLSYGELGKRTAGVAGWARGTFGERAVVALVPRNDRDSVITILGLLRADLAVQVLSPADPLARLRQQVSALGATAVVCPPGVPAEVYPDGVSVPAEAQRGKGDPADAGGSAADPLDNLLYFGTSGSTATSKLVAQSRVNAIANARAVIRHHLLRPGDRVLGCLPIHHVNGLHFTVLGILAAGAHVFLADRFDPLRYPRQLDAFRPRIASVVPSVLEALLDTWRRPKLPAGFDYFVSAAAPLSAHTAKETGRLLGARVLQGYGLTETTNFSTTMPADLSAETYDRLTTAAEIPSVGVALDRNEVAVLRADGSRTEVGEIGEICVRGHNVMNGYARNSAATEEAFQHGWFHSGDLGFVERSAGREFFVLTGRAKNIAKVGGESVSLEEMERTIRLLPGVRDAACVSRPHRFYGEEIVAVVASCPGFDVDVRAALARTFAAPVLPREVVRLDRIPRTPTGKILRRQLRDELTIDEEVGR
jgi:acyl-CoA synthetase (AMP-forming)/AMP-acid ligase II